MESQPSENLWFVTEDLLCDVARNFVYVCSVRMTISESEGRTLRRDHTLSSDLPLMRFFFISPQQKISSLHTGNETYSEFEVFSKRMTFWNIKSNFICFSLHTRSSSCQLGKCTRKLLLIPLIAMKSGNALDLPLSGISLNITRWCLIFFYNYGEYMMSKPCVKFR